MTEDQFEQNAAFRDDHYNRVAKLFNNQWSAEEPEALQKMGWTPVPPSVSRRDWKIYIPEWSRPGWLPSQRYTLDGSHRRAAVGRERTPMIPMIRSPDRLTEKTDYTL